MLNVAGVFCSYEEKEMEEFVVALLVLSHLYAVSPLKLECEQKLEHGLLNTENVVDIFQLALLCDAPRLSLICYRMILKNFKAVSTTEGWKVMKQSHPTLERELLESAIEEDSVSHLFGFCLLLFSSCSATHAPFSCLNSFSEEKGEDQEDK